MVVPKANTKRGRGIKAFDKIIARLIEAASDLYLVLVSGGKLEVESAAGGTLMEIANDTGIVSIGKLEGSTWLAIPEVSSAGVTIVALTAAIADPATLPDGAIYAVKDTADANKIKLVVVYGDAFLVGAALTAAA